MYIEWSGAQRSEQAKQHSSEPVRCLTSKCPPELQTPDDSVRRCRESTAALILIDASQGL